MKKLLLLTCFLSTFYYSLKAQNYHFGLTVTGKGRPMILIPGLNSPGELWNTTVQHFKNRYTCYVITLPGFAGQPPLARKDSITYAQKQEIIQFIKHEKLKKPVLVGFSFGGDFALWLACSNPGLFGPVINVDGLAFDDAFFDENIDKDSIRRADSAKYVKAVNLTPDGWKARYEKRNSPQGFSVGFNYLRDLVTDTTKIPLIMDWDKKTDLRSSTLMQLEMDTLDLRESLINIRQPLLVIGGLVSFNEGHTPPQMKQCFATQFKQAPNCTMVFSEKGRHFLMWDDPDWLWQQMDNFLAK